jgi:hypothetical protein
MPAQELPYFDSLVTGNDYHRPTAPTSDATSTAGAESSQIPNVPGGQPSPVTPVSLATMTNDAPPLGAFLPTNLHEDNWLDPMKPHMSPEPQK